MSSQATACMRNHRVPQHVIPRGQPLPVSLLAHPWGSLRPPGCLGANSRAEHDSAAVMAPGTLPPTTATGAVTKDTV